MKQMASSLVVVLVIGGDQLDQSHFKLASRLAHDTTDREGIAFKLMMGFVIGWLLNLLFLIAVVAIISFQLLCLTDLEFDYINPYDSSHRINMAVLPEFFMQGVLCLAFLINGQWFMSLLSLPYLFYNVRLYMRREHLVDVTEIYNQLHWEKKLRLYKLGFLLILLVLSLFWFLWTIAEEFD